MSERCSFVLLGRGGQRHSWVTARCCVVYLMVVHCMPSFCVFSHRLSAINFIKSSTDRRDSSLSGAIKTGRERQTVALLLSTFYDDAMK